MALLRNGSYLTAIPASFIGGDLSSYLTLKGRTERHNMYASAAGMSAKSGIPNGYSHPGAWLLPQTGGGMTALRAVLALTAEATAAGAKHGTGSATFAITVAPAWGELTASTTGTATFSLTCAAPLLTASLNAAGSTSQTFTATALLGAIANLDASAAIALSASASALPLNDAPVLRTASATFAVTATLLPYATGNMTGTTDAAAGLSATDIAGAVWSAWASQYQTVGSMGGLLAIASEPPVFPAPLDPVTVASAVWNAATATDVTARVALVEAVLRNKSVTDPTTGMMTIYASDGATPLLTAALFEDVTANQGYRGQGANRRERLE